MGCRPIPPKLFRPYKFPLGAMVEPRRGSLRKRSALRDTTILAGPAGLYWTESGTVGDVARNRIPDLSFRFCITGWKRGSG